MLLQRTKFRKFSGAPLFGGLGISEQLKYEMGSSKFLDDPWLFVNIFYFDSLLQFYLWKMHVTMLSVQIDPKNIHWDAPNHITGKECKDPASIDTQIYASGSVDRHSPKTLDGFCYNIPEGKVTVGLSIAACPGRTAGDAYTGWESVSRFIIEEMATL